MVDIIFISTILIFSYHVMKTCTKCKNEKLLSDFGKDKNRPDGRYPQCKSCKNKYYHELYHSNPNASKESVIRKYRLIRRNRVFVRNILTQSKCIDCGDMRWQVLDFDHVRDIKDISICEMILRGYSLQRIQNEINKCDTRCANCHRLKT